MSLPIPTVSHKSSIFVDSIMIASPGGPILLCDVLLGHALLHISHEKHQIVPFPSGGRFSLFPGSVETSLILSTVVASLVMSTPARLEVRTGRKTVESCEPTVRGEVEVALIVGSSGLPSLELIDDVGGTPLGRVLCCWDGFIADRVVEGEAPSSSLGVGGKRSFHYSVGTEVEGGNTAVPATLNLLYLMIT